MVAGSRRGDRELGSVAGAEGRLGGAAAVAEAARAQAPWRTLRRRVVGVRARFRGVPAFPCSMPATCVVGRGRAVASGAGTVEAPRKVKLGRETSDEDAWVRGRRSGVEAAGKAVRIGTSPEGRAASEGLAG